MIMSYNDNSTASTNDDGLVRSLKRLWEIKVRVVGITDVSPTQISTDQFLDHVTFTGDL